MATLTGLFVPTGCDPTVDVFRPSDQFRYSLYGALNVAADTQAIRVSPIDDTTQLGAPSSLDVTVFLRNLNTGERIPLRDSLSLLGTRDVPLHNFWTTHPIRPATSYRVVVQKQGEPVTTATTRTPARPPELSAGFGFLLPCRFPGRFSNDSLKTENTFVVEARNVKRIAAADVIYSITYANSRDTVYLREEFTHYQDVEDKGSYFEIPIFYRPELVKVNPYPSPLPTCPPRTSFTHPYALVAVAAGGPNWPQGWRGLSLTQIANRDTFSNVHGGHGFVAGVYSDTVKVPIQRR
ncbi:MAG: hypothetical protein ABEK84_01695 [Salinibacter sp.]